MTTSMSSAARASGARRASATRGSTRPMGVSSRPTPASCARDAAGSASTLEVRFTALKRTRFGRYELLAELGRGGMAELFLARLGGAGGFSKLLAIKRILPHLSDDPQFVALFLNEARIAAQLPHPNVCTVFELGAADGQLSFAMVDLDGGGGDTLGAAAPTDPSERLRLVAGVFAQACVGLH